MNLFEYLDRRNQHSHLRRLIKYHNKQARDYGQVLVTNCPESHKNTCLNVIKEHDDKVFYYTNKLMKLL